MGGTGGGSGGEPSGIFCENFDTNAPTGWYSKLVFFIGGDYDGDIQGYSEWYWDNATQIISENTNTATTSRIDNFTYSTTTNTANITGYWNTSNNPNITERLSFWQYSDTLGQERYNQIIATSTGYFNLTFDFNSPYAWDSSTSSTSPIFFNFTLNASLDEYNTTNYVFGQLPPENYITNIDNDIIELFADDYNAEDFITTTRDLALYPEYECGISNITGCFKNALIWAFYPTQEALDKWTNFKTTLEKKAPIGYFYIVKNNITNINATSIPNFSITIPDGIKRYIFDPFDIAIASIVWISFLIFFYKRLKNIQL